MAMDEKKLTRILSIDGGGIRGILPGQVLVSLEQMLQEISGDDNARLADYFDLIAGTSTGGILSCIYLCPDNSGRPKFTAEEAVNLYLAHGNKIFDVSLWQKIKSGDGALDEKYSADALEATLGEYLGDIKLNELLRPCLITAYDVHRRKAHFFTSDDAQHDKDNFLVRDVARATSAAPTYFEAAQISSLSGVSYPLIDGGVFANNPSLCAFAEARKLQLHEGRRNAMVRDMAILSIGTGSIEKPYEYEDVKDWGQLQWIKPLIDIMMTGVSETVDYELQQLFDAADCPDQYLRVMPILGDASPEMDDADENNLQALKEAGIETAEIHHNKLRSFAQLLIDHA